MNPEKYIGMDVHAATISAAVMNAEGKLLMQCVLETKAATILEFIQGLRGTLAVTFEEGTMAAWLHDLLKPHVSRLVRAQSALPFRSPHMHGCVYRFSLSSNDSPVKKHVEHPLRSGQEVFSRGRVIASIRQI